MCWRRTCIGIRPTARRLERGPRPAEPGAPPTAGGLGGGAAPGGPGAAAPSWWTPAAAGDEGGGFGVTAPGVRGGTAVFSAGTDALGPFTVSIGGTQSVGGINIEEGNVTFAGAGTIDIGTPGVTVDTAAGTKLTSSAIIAGAGGRSTKSGAGTLVIATVLNQANSFDAGVTVNGGVLEFPGENSATGGANNPLGKAPSSVVANYLQLSNGGTLRSTRI